MVGTPDLLALARKHGKYHVEAYAFVGEGLRLLGREVFVALPDLIHGLAEHLRAYGSIHETRQVAFLATGPGQIAPHVSVGLFRDHQIPTGHGEPLSAFIHLYAYYRLVRRSSQAFGGDGALEHLA